MRNGRNPGAQLFLAAAAIALLAAPAARGQTPIPTLPPLPPLPAAGEAPTPAPTAAPSGAESVSTPPITAQPATAQPAAAQPTPAPSPAPAAAAAPPEAPGGLPSSVLILLGVGVLVLVATLAVVLTVLLKKPVVINVPSRSAAPPPMPEGRAAPPPGPQDVLPGRFLVDEGDRQTELRIFRTGPGERVETTIGRDPGPPYRHIQLLPESVAGKHAKLVFDRRSWSLINYARANPTRVNGEEVEENASRRLVDGDRIEIGEIVMTYRED